MYKKYNKTKSKLPFNYLTSKQIRDIRTKFGLSQSNFAKLLRVNVRTYQNWEIGHRVPSGPACALLEHAAKNPELFLEIK